jgi:hypothetical protein
MILASSSFSSSRTFMNLQIKAPILCSIELDPAQTVTGPTCGDYSKQQRQWKLWMHSMCHSVFSNFSSPVTTMKLQEASTQRLSWFLMRRPQPQLSSHPSPLLELSWKPTFNRWEKTTRLPS